MPGGKIPSLISLLLLIAVEMNSQNIIEVGGIIYYDTVWEADTVKLIDDVYIADGIALLVKEGVYVQAQDYYGIYVTGKIQAFGTSDAPVVFSALDTLAVHQDTLSPNNRGWAGIHLNGVISSPDTSYFIHSRLEYSRRIDTLEGSIMGGAISVKNYHTLIVENAVIRRNLIYNHHDNGVTHGAGIYAANTNSVIIQGCDFIENRSSYYGGGVAIGAYCDHVRILNNRFLANQAIKYIFYPPWLLVTGAGGAIHCSDAYNFSPEIGNNYCYNNKGISGIIYTSNLSALIYNNLVCNNLGPGLFDGHQLSTSRMFNNTIANNRSFHGGIYVNSKAHIYNNIIWNNRAESGALNPQIYISSGNPTLSYNCVHYGDGGEGAIFDNPEFTHPTTIVGLVADIMAKWSLKGDSPCINAGTPDTTGLFIPEYDINGDCRIAGTTIDIGAYEYQNVVGHEEMAYSTSLTIFPNPGKNYFEFKGDDDLYHIEVYDSKGRLVLRHHSVSSGRQIHSGHLAPGLYSINFINTNSQQIYRKKWIMR